MPGDHAVAHGLDRRAGGRDVIHQRKTVDARQHDIEDDQVKFLRFQQIGGAFTVVRNDERLAQRFQRHGNQLGNARLVVDDQNWQHGEYLLPVGVRTV